MNQKLALPSRRCRQNTELFAWGFPGGGSWGEGGANLLLAKSWINYKHLRGVSPMFADVAAAACRKEESGSSSLPSVDRFEIKLLIAAQIFPRWTACL